jgi:hypothetical protein
MAMQVHQYDTFYLVGLNEESVLQDFGGCLQFDINGNYVTGTKSTPRDAVDLYRVIRSALIERNK